MGGAAGGEVLGTTQSGGYWGMMWMMCLRGGSRDRGAGTNRGGQGGGAEAMDSESTMALITT